MELQEFFAKFEGSDNKDVQSRASVLSQNKDRVNQTDGSRRYVKEDPRRSTGASQNRRQYSNYFYDLKTCGLIDEDDDDDFEREQTKNNDGGLADFVFEEIPDSKTGGI